MYFGLRLVALWILAMTSAPAGEAHPRLLFGPEDLQALRAKATSEPFASMLARLHKDLETNESGVGKADPTKPYEMVSVALRAAFLYVVTNDPAMAKRARDIVAEQINGEDWENPNSKGLRLYFIGSRVALAYDMCYGAPEWDSAFSAQVSSKLAAMGELIVSSGGTEQNTKPESNWQGSRYGAGGLCLLASDAAVDAAKIDFCYARVVRYLKSNLGESPKSRGWNSEGLGYTYFPMGNYVGPFAVAMQRKDPAKDVRKAAPASQMSLWTTLAAYSTALGGIRPDFGDDNAGVGGEGSIGLSFWMTPEPLKPGLVYWYDRTVGSKGNGTFDNARTGTLMSYLFHPGSAVKEADPMSIPDWKKAFIDTEGNGFYTLRNRYQDADDGVAQLFAKHRAPGGHSGPDSLSYRLIGQGTAWAVGGGRYGVKHNGQEAYWRSQNTIYPVNPDEKLAINSDTSKVVGTPIVASDGGGTVVLSAGKNNVGTSGHIRRFAADFSRSGAEGCYVIVDTSSDGKFWQHCTYGLNTITVDGSSFTITSEHGATMVGTVLYPANAVLAIGHRPRGTDHANGVKDNRFVTVAGSDGAFVVVLTAQAKGKAAPKPTATGTWGSTPKGTITVGKLSVSVDGSAIALAP